MAGSQLLFWRKKKKEREKRNFSREVSFFSLARKKKRKFEKKPKNHSYGLMTNPTAIANSGGMAA